MGLPVISARALTVSPTPIFRPPCLRGFLCRSCAPDTGTHEGWRCCDYFEKSWDPGSKSTPELPGCVRGWSAVSPDTSGPPFSCGRTVTCDAHREVHKSRASPKSPQSTQLRHWLWCRSACRASAAPSDRGDRSQVKSGIGNSAAEAIGSGVVALGELQQLLLRIRKPAFGGDAA
jgi:hypothetical protein